MARSKYNVRLRAAKLRPLLICYDVIPTPPGAGVVDRFSMIQHRIGRVKDQGPDPIKLKLKHPQRACEKRLQCYRRCVLTRTGRFCRCMCVCMHAAVAV